MAYISNIYRNQNSGGKGLTNKDLLTVNRIKSLVIQGNTNFNKSKQFKTCHIFSKKGGGANGIYVGEGGVGVWRGRGEPVALFPAGGRGGGGGGGGGAPAPGRLVRSTRRSSPVREECARA